MRAESKRPGKRGGAAKSQHRGAGATDEPDNFSNPDFRWTVGFGKNLGERVAGLAKKSGVDNAVLIRLMVTRQMAEEENLEAMRAELRARRAAKPDGAGG